MPKRDSYSHMIGQRFNRLVVLGLAEPEIDKNGWKRATVLCQCDCGTEKVIVAKSLLNSLTQSCGCLRRELVAAKNKRNSLHEETKSRRTRPKVDKYAHVIGKRFNRFLVVKEAESTWSSGVRRRKFLCQCDCGNTKTVEVTSLIAGRSESCGCIRREQLAERNFRHGSAVRGNLTPYYNMWLNMIQRCYNPKNPSYPDYGGRGIEVPYWKDNFTVFLDSLISELGERQPGMSLDRINNDGNYEPGNVRWADRETQANNRREQRPRKRKLPPRKILRD